MHRALTAIALFAIAIGASHAQAPGHSNLKPSTQIKPQTGGAKALNPQPLPPGGGAARSSTVAATNANVRALNPQPLPPAEAPKKR